jgi:hypothetical protein
LIKEFESRNLFKKQFTDDRRVSPPPVLGGGAHSLAREGLGESQFRRGDIHCGTLTILVGFGLACAPVFFGLINMQNGALRAPPPAHRSFAASYTVFTPQTFPSGPNLGHQGC